MVSLRRKTKLQRLNVPEGLIFLAKRGQEEKYFGPRPRILPLMERDGWYYDKSRDMCWIELDGKAWPYDRDHFKYELQHLTALERPFSREQISAMMLVLDRCSKRDKLYQDFKLYQEASKDSLYLRMSGWKTGKRLKAFMEKRGLKYNTTKKEM